MVTNPTDAQKAETIQILSGFRDSWGLDTSPYQDLIEQIGSHENPWTSATLDAVMGLGFGWAEAQARQIALRLAVGSKGAQLIDDLVRGGTKITPENVVDIRKLPDGKIVWLETGNSRAGLQHIVEGHIEDFAARGVPRDKIPNLILDALEKGKIVGTTGTGQNIRSVYEVNFNGTTQKLVIGIGSNGFVVTAHPF